MCAHLKCYYFCVCVGVFGTGLRDYGQSDHVIIMVGSDPAYLQITLVKVR